MSCERYAEAIVDHAYGAELTAAAARHLEGCERCAGNAAAQRRRLDELDAEVQAAVSIEPSAAFASRVRAEVETVSPRRIAWPWLTAPLAAAAVLALVFVASTDRARPAASSPTTVQPAPRLAADEPARPVPEPTTAAAERRPRPVAARRPSMPTAAREPEIIVPPDRARALAQYMNLVRSGRIEASPLLQPMPAQLTEPASLTVGPLAVEPIAIPQVEFQHRAVDDGVQKEETIR